MTTEHANKFVDQYRELRGVLVAFNGGGLTALPDDDPNLIDFPGAILAMRAGFHVARDGWPIAQYVTLQAGYPDGIPINANTAAATGLPVGTPCTFPPYLTKCTGTSPRPTFPHWQPTTDDVLACDWRLIR